MKILFLSDLHLSFNNKSLDIQQTEFDVVVLTGDIDTYTKGAIWAINNFINMPIIYIAGNHEYYGYDIEEVNKELYFLSTQYNNFYFLNNNSVIIDDIKFIGTSLWSNFLLYGKDNQKKCIEASEIRLNDYNFIRYKNAYLNPIGVEYFSNSSIEYIRHELEFNSKPRASIKDKNTYTTVVCTHNGPSKLSLNPFYGFDYLNASFCNDMESFIMQWQPNYWLHGHTHYNVNYNIGATNVISNQRGYLEYDKGLNKSFNPNHIIEV